MPLSSIREDARQYLIVDTVKRLNSRLAVLERTQYQDLIADSLTLGNPISDVGGVGDLSMEGSLETEGWINVGQPITPAALEGDVAIEGDLSVEGTFSNTGVEAGLVTNGDSHDHSGGDGAQIPESGLQTGVQNQLVTNGDSHNHSGGDGAVIPESGLATAVQDQLVTGGDSHTHSLPADIEASSGMTVGATGKNPATGDIEFFNGSTQVGQIGTDDTTWLRINQDIAKNVYTPRYFRADAGLATGGRAPGSGDCDITGDFDTSAGDLIAAAGGLNIGGVPASTTSGQARYTGDLTPYRNSTSYSVYGVHFYTTPLTNGSWDGDDKANGTTTLTLTGWGAPNNIKGVLVAVGVQVSSLSPTNQYVAVGPSSGNWAVIARPQVVNVVNDNTGFCPCSSGGDIVVIVVGPTSGTCNVWITLWGYAI